ncbi:hypothetical protein [Sphingomonas sp. MS122]|uniref:hypothetical protein n=1 Tax=Sphingomonas sp. MS122 TaxID=3412683 RepID=UPI003C2F21B1
MTLLARLCLIAAMLWCCANVAEPAQAHGAVQVEQAASAAHDHGDSDCDDRGEIAQGGHHHCHVAPDPRPRPNDAQHFGLTSLFFASPSTRLDSRAQAPPLEPPSA